MVILIAILPFHLLIAQNYNFNSNIKSLNDLRGYSFITKSLEIGQQYALIDDFDKAEEYYTRAVNVGKDEPEKNVIAQILLRKSENYFNLNSKDLRFYKKSYEAATQSIDITRLESEARRILKILIGLEFKPIDEELKNDISNKIAELKYEYSVTDQEIANLRNEFQESIDSSPENQIKKAIESISKYQRELKENKAIRDSLLFDLNISVERNEIADSIENSNIQLSEKIDDLVLIQEQSNENSKLLTREKNLLTREKNLLTKQKNLYRAIAILGIILSALLIAGLFYFRKLNKKLYEQKGIIEIEKKKSEDALRREAESLREINERETLFYSNITHEIRTPLTVINGMATQILQQPDKWLERGIKLIKNNTNEVMQLVNSLLEVSKVDSGYVKVSNIQSDIVEYINYIVMSYSSYAESKNINLEANFITGLCIMDFDVDKIKTILVNLLSNAIKYSEKNGQVTVRMEAIKSEINPKFRMDVIDDGVGISKDDQTKLFDRYYQVINDETRYKTGSGIGLSHTKSLVDLIGAEIFIESEVGKGSKFTVIIPITNNADFIKIDDLTNKKVQLTSIEDTYDNAVLKENLKLDTDKPTILIIEDNKDVLVTLVAFLEGLYNIITAVNGEEGINVAIKEVPDLIVSDVMMPEKDGFEVCKVLKKHILTSHIPIILLTALNDKEYETKGREIGVNDYVAKPPDESLLILKIKNLLQSTEKIIENYPDIIKRRTPELNPNELFEKQLNEVIDRNIEDINFKRAELCDELGLKLNQVHNKLKALKKQSIPNYIKSYRLEKAKGILSDPENINKTIKEVAWEVGIRPNYFNREFKSYFGITPNEYRKQLFDSML